MDRAPPSSTSTRPSSPRRRWWRSAARCTGPACSRAACCSGRPGASSSTPSSARRRSKLDQAARLGARASPIGWDQAEIGADRARDAGRRGRADRLRRGARAHPRAPGARAARCSSCRPHPRRSSRRSPSYLGVDEAIATRAELDDRRPLHRPHRAATATGPTRWWPCEDAAERDGIDLARVVRVQRLGHRPADARGGRPPGGGEPRPRAAARRRERNGLGGAPVHPPGAAARAGAHARAAPRRARRRARSLVARGCGSGRPLVVGQATAPAPDRGASSAPVATGSAGPALRSGAPHLLRGDGGQRNDHDEQQQLLHGGDGSALPWCASDRA